MRRSELHSTCPMGRGRGLVRVPTRAWFPVVAHLGSLGTKNQALLHRAVVCPGCVVQSQSVPEPTVKCRASSLGVEATRPLLLLGGDMAKSLFTVSLVLAFAATLAYADEP